MSATPDVEGPRTRWRAWTIAIVVVLALVGGLTWAMLAFRPAGESAPPAAAQTTAPPQPTVVDTPTPGATTPVTKPQDAKEVPIDKPAKPVDGAVLEVTSLEALTAGKDVPGEKSGPAVKVSVRITNNGTKAIDTAGSNVNFTYGGDEQLPAVALTTDDNTVWPDSIAPGASATAVYTFSVPLAPKGDIRVIVDLLASAPDVVFVGARP